MTSSQKRKFEDISNAEPYQPILKKRKLIEDDTPNEESEIASNEQDNIDAVISIDIKSKMNEIKLKMNESNETETENLNQNSIEDDKAMEISPNDKQEMDENKNEKTIEIIENDKQEMDENTNTNTNTTDKIDPYKQYNWESAQIILKATSTFADINNKHFKYLDGGNFIKSIYWSPNGLHLLSNSNDRKLRIFNPFNSIYSNNTQNEDENDNKNEMKASVMYEHTEPIYDISFYPLFKTNDYASNVFISCSRDSPIFMFDSWQNNKRCSYQYLFGDIMMTPYSVTFSNDGQYILAGYKKYIIQFQTAKPGHQHCKKIKCVNKNNFGQKSIISDIKFMNQNNNIFAVASYDGIAQLFDIRCTFALCGFKCMKNINNGITNVHFSPCNNYLLCGSRKTNDINCWDLRYIKDKYYYHNTFQSDLNFDIFNDGNTKVFKDNDNKNSLCTKYKRDIINNQRVQFDIDKYTGYWIVSGNQKNNYCAVYDVNTDAFDVQAKYKLTHDKSVESVSAAQICPTYPFLATAIGQRVLKRKKLRNNDESKNDMEIKSDNDSDSESDSETDEKCTNINDICIWDLRFK